jgi:hypothetical protein
MKKNALELRVAALEQEVAKLKASVLNWPNGPTWQKTIGMFAGDEITREVLEEAMKLREKDRAQARRRASSQRAKS